MTEPTRQGEGADFVALLSTVRPNTVRGYPAIAAPIFQGKP